MAKTIRSARGVQVDFDLVLIKQQIASAAAPTNVQARTDFIENKVRRSRRIPKVGVKPAEPDVIAEALPVIPAEDFSDVPEPEEFIEPEEELSLPVEKPVVKPVKK